MPWRRRESGGMPPLFLTLGPRWRWVVSFTLLPLYPRGNSSQCALYRRLGEPQSRFGRYGKDKTVFLVMGTKPRFLVSACRLVPIPNVLCRLRLHKQNVETLTSKNSVVCIAAAMQRPWNGRICRTSFWATTRYTHYRGNGKRCCLRGPFRGVINKISGANS
jgi:hypothetical protein